MMPAPHWERTRDLPQTEPSVQPLPFLEGGKGILGGTPSTPAKGAVAPLDSRLNVTLISPLPRKMAPELHQSPTSVPGWRCATDAAVYISARRGQELTA